MKYGINVFNNLKGYHNLLIFNNEGDAKESYNLLDNLWNNSDDCEDFDEIDFEILYASAYSKSIDCIENIIIEEQIDEEGVIKNCKYTVNDSGFIKSKYEDVKVLFDNQSVCVPA